MLRIVKKNKRFYSILIILLLLSLSATAQEEYAVPAVPDTITNVTARADYAVSHYWERYDFSNAQLLQREGYTEQALSNFIALLGYASAQVQQQAVNQWLTSAAANQETFCFMVDMADKYLNDQESPLHNDHLYLLVARHIIDSSAANDAQRQRAQFMVNLLTGNAVGTIAPDFSFRDLAHKVAVSRFEEDSRIDGMLDSDADFIAECHLADRLGHACSAAYIDREDPSGLLVFAQFGAGFKNRLIVRQKVSVFRHTDPDEGAAGFFQLRCYEVGDLGRIDREAHECRRDVDRLEGSGHRVLSSDGRKAQSDLSCIGTEKGRERLAPAGRFLRHPAEIFLEGKADLRDISARCRDLGCRCHDCPGCSVIRAPG